MSYSKSHPIEEDYSEGNSLIGKEAVLAHIYQERRILMFHGLHHELVFVLGLGRIGEGNGNPLQYSCLENPMDEEAWWATVREVAKSQT